MADSFYTYNSNYFGVVVSGLTETTKDSGIRISWFGKVVIIFQRYAELINKRICWWTRRRCCVRPMPWDVFNKRLISWSILLYVLFQLFICPVIACAIRNTSDSSHYSVGRFPKALLYVEEEAFEGTAFEVIAFEHGFLSAADRAFSEMVSLKIIYAPNSVEYIADSAFEHSSLRRVMGEKGTYIQKWAEKHNVEFAPVDSCLSAPVKMRSAGRIGLFPLWLLCPPLDLERKKIKYYLDNVIFSMRPQDRSELNSIDNRFP